VCVCVGGGGSVWQCEVVMVVMVVMVVVVVVLVVVDVVLLACG
jgi:hypothetical protein